MSYSIEGMDGNSSFYWTRSGAQRNIAKKGFWFLCSPIDFSTYVRIYEYLWKLSRFSAIIF